MRVAVAGLGGIGLLHARNVARLGGARLVLVVDQDAALARTAGSQLATAWSASFDDALDQETVDAVVVATPTPLHALMVERAARAGKHVFCEKPLSVDLDSGRIATHAAATAGICLQIGFHRRFDPDFLEASERVEAGELGRIQLLRISHRNRVPPHAGDLTGRLGSALIDMTIHDFDTARWLVGEVGEVHAFASLRSHVVVGRFENGALCVIDNARAAIYGYECAVELMGEESTLRIGWNWSASGVEQLTEQGRIEGLPADNVERHREAYFEELRHFVACVTSGTTPAVGGADSVAALELSLAAERCLT